MGPSKSSAPAHQAALTSADDSHPDAMRVTSSRHRHALDLNSLLHVLASPCSERPLSSQIMFCCRYSPYQTHPGTLAFDVSCASTNFLMLRVLGNLTYLVPTCASKSFLHVLQKANGDNEKYQGCHTSSKFCCKRVPMLLS